jgi:amino acid efflux transporter
MTIPPAPVAEVRSGGGGSMGIVQGTGFAVMAVLGTGIISLPSLAGRTAGPASLVAWVAMVLASAPLALTIAALAARSPGAGGTSTYVREAFGGTPPLWSAGASRPRCQNAASTRWLGWHWPAA